MIRYQFGDSVVALICSTLITGILQQLKKQKCTLYSNNKYIQLSVLRGRVTRTKNFLLHTNLILWCKS